MLVRPKAQPRRELRWDERALRVLDHLDRPDVAGGFLRVLGGPGTGKTTLLTETVVRRIVDRGVDPEHVLVLTPNRRAAQDLRERIAARLTGLAGGTELAGGAAGEPPGLLRTVREPLVRSVHSYAFAVLRLQATLHGDPPPRLLSGPEQDSGVRELLVPVAAIAAASTWRSPSESSVSRERARRQSGSLIHRRNSRSIAPCSQAGSNG